MSSRRSTSGKRWNEVSSRYQHLHPVYQWARPQLRTRFLATPGDDIAVCAIVKAEMFYGAAKSKTPGVSLAKQRVFLDRFTCLYFDDAAAAIYGPMRARLEQQGTPIGSHDMLIAAIALANDLILVTHNTSEFRRIEGLQIEDWEAQP